MAAIIPLDVLGAQETQEVCEPELELEEKQYNSAEIQTLARDSLDFFAALAMPTVFKYEYPPVLQVVWQWLLEHTFKYRSFPQLALGLPRGFSKTTLVKLYMLYCILFSQKKFILIFCSTARLAENILSDVIDMLEEPNIKTTFGDWKLGIEKDTQQIKKFGYRGRNIILVALGAESSVRGLNLKNERPDVMVFDDIQTRECAESTQQTDSLERWLIGTAMKAKSPFGCTYIYIANMYPTPQSILKKLKLNPNWIKFIAGGIQSDGTSLWEELHPLEQLLQEFQNDVAMGRPELFYSEVLNDETASAHNLIDLSLLKEVPIQSGDIPAGNFIIIDPATDKLGSDAVSIGYFEVHDTYPILMELKEGRFSPGETIRVALEFALNHNCRLIAVESNAYQYSLLYWFNFICMQMGISGVEAVEIYSGSSSKNSRILTMLKSYAAGEIFVHDSCKPSVHLQIIQFNPLKRENTDGLLDLLTYAPRVLAEFEDFVISNSIIGYQEYASAKVHSLEENCSF